ncbi:MAG: GTPase [Cyanobacteria bacterium J06600_6]
MMDQEQINNPLQELVQKLHNAKDKQFTFLLVGRAGVGKSSTVNSLMGKEIAKVGDFEATTKIVQEYTSEMNGVKFNVVDTPGLCDDLEEEGNDSEYLNLMLSQVKEIDSMWFVSRLDDTRVTGDEKRGIKLITQAFGVDVWKHAVIVFTFADNVKQDKYDARLDKRTELIRKEIEKQTKSTKIANNIPSVAVDNNSETTPDGKKWLGELYTKVFTRMSQNGLTSFLVATAEFIAPQGNISSFEPDFNNQSVKNQQQSKPRIELNEAQKKEIKKTINASIIPASAIVGASIGSVIPGIGTVAGGAIGAGVALLAWLWD